jgi:hypothetical protein
MICFQIFINGKKICTAGIQSEFGVLTSILTWVKRDLSQFSSEDRHKMYEEEIDFNVGGHISYGKNDYENLDWIKRSLSPGDEIKIKIIESPQADEPSSRVRSDPDFVEKQKRKYFERLKNEYEKEQRINRSSKGRPKGRRP